jgi:hypothetical protein
VTLTRRVIRSSNKFSVTAPIVGRRVVGLAVALVPYAVLGRLATAGRPTVLAFPLRLARLLEGVIGISFSVMAGEAPRALVAALLPARVERLEDMMPTKRFGLERRLAVSLIWE